MRLLAFALFGISALAACQSRSSEREPVERARVALENGESVLDTRDDGATLIVRQLASPPQSDGQRRLAVRMVIGTRTIELGTEERPLADARLVPGGVVVVGLDGVLARVAEAGGRREIDRNVYAPISVRGTSVAYARGEPPTVEVVLADVEKGEPLALAPDFSPAWCPAIADDGAVVFVTGHTGSPQLARVRAGEAPRVIVAQPDAFPEGPDAPRVNGNLLTFYFRGAQRTVALGELR